MCGIFGYKGNKTNAAEIVFDGLRRLDYRGYDSWGVGVVANGTLTVEKEVGKIGGNELIAHLPESSTSIAHTRWATTGSVTKINAHPHMSSDGSFILAQNGIVENFEELKNQCIAEGYNFISETDTEVIVALIEKARKTEPDFKHAIQATFAQLEGRNTIILLTRDGEIFAARNGSPLVLGVNTDTDEVFVSSDILSCAPQVNKMIVVDNHQMVHIDNEKHIHISDTKTGQEQDYVLEDVTVEAGRIDKEGYDHFMLKEIFESPTVIKQIAMEDKARIDELVTAIKSAEHVYVIGSGTAGIAAMQIAFYLRTFAQVNAISLVGADAKSHYEIFTKNDLIIAPSQSGETADVIEVLEFAKEKGLKIASIVNMAGSMMTRMSDYPFMAKAGPEICVMSTKVFTAQVAWGYLIAKAAQGKLDEGIENLNVLATAVHAYLENQENHDLLKKTADHLSQKEHIFMLGKYQNYAVMCEGMVKIIEGAYKHAHAIPAGDLKHYAITLMEKGVPVIAAVSKDEVENDMVTAINEVRLRGAEVIAISYQNHDNFDYFIPVEDTFETSAIHNIIPLQLLAYYMAVILGNNIDKPRNIAKSVTVK